jgi:tetratricopeptide (TPR) repeat protein
VVFLNAIGLYNKPSMFGGDREAALDGFKRAARLTAQETVSDPLAPRWGRADALAWTGVAHIKAGRPTKARAAFREALRVNPDFGWVRDVLMPQLAASSDGARR